MHTTTNQGPALQNNSNVSKYTQKFHTSPSLLKHVAQTPKVLPVNLAHFMLIYTTLLHLVEPQPAHIKTLLTFWPTYICHHCPQNKSKHSRTLTIYLKLSKLSPPFHYAKPLALMASATNTTNNFPPCLPHIFVNPSTILLIPPEFPEVIITTIPKLGKPSNDPASYRPISLLNTDTKLYAKLIAILPSRIILYLVHPDQVCFVAGRQASDGTHRYIDLLQWVEHH